MCTHTEKHAYTSHIDKTKPNNKLWNTQKSEQKQKYTTSEASIHTAMTHTVENCHHPCLSLCVDSFSGKFPFSRCWRLQAMSAPTTKPHLSCYVHFSFLNLFFIICVWLPHKHTKNQKKTLPKSVLAFYHVIFGNQIQVIMRHLQLLSHLNCAFLFFLRQCLMQPRLAYNSGCNWGWLWTPDSSPPPPKC